MRAGCVMTVRTARLDQIGRASGNLTTRSGKEMRWRQPGDVRLQKPLGVMGRHLATGPAAILGLSPTIDDCAVYPHDLGGGDDPAAHPDHRRRWFQVHHGAYGCALNAQSQAS